MHSRHALYAFKCELIAHYMLDIKADCSNITSANLIMAPFKINYTLMLFYALRQTGMLAYYLFNSKHS